MTTFHSRITFLRYFFNLALGVSMLLLLGVVSTTYAQQQTQTSQTEEGDAKPKGKLVISVSEAESEIKILNRFNMVEVKKTQAKKKDEYRLKEGMYRIEVSKKNYLAVFRDVYISTGMQQELYFDLQPYIEEKKGIFGAAYTGGPKKKSGGASKYLVVVGVAAVVLGAAAILMGGSETGSTLPSPPGRP